MEKILPEKSPFTRVAHIGVVVRDMDKAIAYYQSLGIGPFEPFKSIVAIERKMLGKPEKQKLKRGYERAKEILKNAGAKGIFKTGYLAAHPGGTVKVGDIVDSNLKTEYDNLYVCDCSVIPEAWGLPPTNTLIALGKRLSKHLLKD